MHAEGGLEQGKSSLFLGNEDAPECEEGLPIEVKGNCCHLNCTIYQQINQLDDEDIYANSITMENLPKGDSRNHK